MAGAVIRKARGQDAKQFIGLVVGLAEFEKLAPPSKAGQRRLVDDVFKKKRVNLFVAAERDRLVGYALYFYTYSSFFAQPSFYVVDLFVLRFYRKAGGGFALFRRCVDEAISNGCGRMEWTVLSWNEKAIRFYERLGAERLLDWQLCRLDEDSLRKVPRAAD